MNVFVGPRTDLESETATLGVARALAGPGGRVVSLREIGVRTLGRTLSAAEVALLRKALSERLPSPDASSHGDTSEELPGIVGYVCRGVRLAAPDADAADALAVSDHVNLTWRSPLRGPNDDNIGPRFPSMTGIYASQKAVDRLAGEGMIVVPGVVAGVNDDDRLSAIEREMAALEAYRAASSELVPVAIVAAHMGLRLAAVVLLRGLPEKEIGSGQP